MIAASKGTTVVHAFRAGIELAEAIAPIQPDLAFVFASIDYSENAKLLEGIGEVLGRDVPVVGCTGDGCYETRASEEFGAAILGLKFESRVRFGIGTGGRIGHSPARALRQAMTTLQRQMGPVVPQIGILLSDFRLNAARLEDALQAECPMPVVGGLAGDSYQIKRSAVFIGRRVLRDALVLVGLGGDIRYEFGCTRELRKVGAEGRITGVAPGLITHVDDMSAVAFVEKALGRPMLKTDRGMVVLMFHRPGETNWYRQRSVIEFNVRQGQIGLFGDMQVGMDVHTCIAVPKQLVQNDRKLGHRLGDAFPNPAAGLVFGCSGRKHVLGNNCQGEIDALVRGMKWRFPMAGLPSFGEIGPVRDGKSYSPPLFHNMSLVTLLLGD
jgi:hypothetical protein